VQLLERLGLARMLSFEKRRESWRSRCKVELDELPYLGCFVEVEGPAEQPVSAVRNNSASSDRPIVSSSYVALLMGHLQERGQTTKIVTFADAERGG
jgi:hypothetical protein